MMPRDVFYIPPKLRIQIGRPDPRPTEYIIVDFMSDQRDEMWRLQRDVEGERIFEIIREFSQ